MAAHGLQEAGYQPRASNKHSHWVTTWIIQSSTGCHRMPVLNKLELKNTQLPDLFHHHSFKAMDYPGPSYSSRYKHRASLAFFSSPIFIETEKLAFSDCLLLLHVCAMKKCLFYLLNADLPLRSIQRFLPPHTCFCPLPLLAGVSVTASKRSVITQLPKELNEVLDYKG